MEMWKWECEILGELPWLQNALLAGGHGKVLCIDIPYQRVSTPSYLELLLGVRVASLWPVDKMDCFVQGLNVDLGF